MTIGRFLLTAFTVALAIPSSGEGRQLLPAPPVSADIALTIPAPPTEPPALYTPELTIERTSGTAPATTIRYITERMTIPVSIASGPKLNFLIDTGAEVSGVTHEVARRYGLEQTGSRIVVGVGGRREIATVRVPSLRFSRSDSTNVEALLFARAAMGADGFLGTDMLANQRIEFDFVKGKMQLSKASRGGIVAPRDSIVVKARRSRGPLLFSSARVNQIAANLILDTGSAITIGNAALLRQLVAKHRIGKTIKIHIRSVTGEVLTVDYGILRKVSIGDVEINRLPIAFSTVEPFRQLGWEDRPAILLGMDSMRAFDAVTVDFRNRAVAFVARGCRNTDTCIRVNGKDW